MCRLIKALYGHPEAGAHWDRHLRAALKQLGGEPILAHPSSYHFKDSLMLLTVYVDDLLLSGPCENHAIFWSALAKSIDIDPPEDLDRFLGRTHTISEESK